MIKNYNPRPFEQASSLSTYVKITNQYELLARTKDSYVIRLVKLTVGTSMSAGKPLSHVLFESFSDHGERRAIAKTRIGGYNSAFFAVLSAMTEIGVDFEFVTPCHFEEILTELGASIQAGNPDIASYEIVSLNCH